MEIFKDLLSKGSLYKVLEENSLVCKPFSESHIKFLKEYGWYDELYTNNSEPNFIELQNLPVYVIFIDEYKKDIIQNLIRAYQPLSKIREEGHFFDFLIINAKLEIACGIGLGRKNQFFSFTSQNGSEFKHNDEKKEEYLNSSMPWKFLTEIKNTLKEIGLTMFERDHLPANETLLEEALHNGPNENGFYKIDDLSYEDENYTKEDIQNYIQEFNALDEIINYHGMILSQMFPSLEVSELNSGDY